MWRIWLALGATALIFLGTISRLCGESLDRRVDFRITARVPVAIQLSRTVPTVESCLATNREVVWHPHPNGGNPFGFIPTHSTARAQLLPLMWDVRTVFASADDPEAKAGRGDFSPRLKMARFD